MVLNAKYKHGTSLMWLRVLRMVLPAGSREMPWLSARCEEFHVLMDDHLFTGKHLFCTSLMWLCLLHMVLHGYILGFRVWVYFGFISGFILGFVFFCVLPTGSWEHLWPSARYLWFADLQ